MKKSPYTPWLLMYFAANIIAAFVMYDSNELIGDVAGSPLHSKKTLILAVSCVVISYAIIMGPVFNLASRIKVTPLFLEGDDERYKSRLGILLVLLQIAFMAFNIAYGVNIAGSNNTRTDSIFSLFWVLVPADTLFLIFYGFYRENKYFYPNLIVWIISNITRGWSGVFMIIAFFEFCRAFRKGNIKIKKTLPYLLILIMLYPIILNIKWVFRATSNGLSLFTVAEAVLSAFSGKDYIILIWDGILNLIARLQVTSVVIEVIRLSNNLQSDFSSGRFSPFWMEGLHGIFFDRLFSGARPFPVGEAITQYGSFGQNNVGDWNTNIGYVGWLFISPYLAPIYIAYTIALGVISFYFAKKIAVTDSSKDMLWLVWLIYLMPPWLGAVVGFIYALFVFLVIKIILMKMPKFTLALKH